MACLSALKRCFLSKTLSQKYSSYAQSQKLRNICHTQLDEWIHRSNQECNTDGVTNCWSLDVNYIGFQIMPESFTDIMMNENQTYHADFLKKEDSTGRWRIYWASLNLTGLYFHKEKTQEQNSNFLHLIELTPGSRCVLAKRRMYSFRFKVITEKGCYTLKCETVLQRYRWMYMIDLLVKGRQREQPPNVINPAVINYSIDEKDSSIKSPYGMKFGSFIRTLSIGNFRVWKKQNNNVPSTQRLRKKENHMDGHNQRTSGINNSINFAENFGYFED